MPDRPCVPCVHRLRQWQEESRRALRRVTEIGGRAESSQGAGTVRQGQEYSRVHCDGCRRLAGERNRVKAPGQCVKGRSTQGCIATGDGDWVSGIESRRRDSASRTGAIKGALRWVTKNDGRESRTTTTTTTTAVAAVTYYIYIYTCYILHIIIH